MNKLRYTLTFELDNPYADGELLPARKVICEDENGILLCYGTCKPPSDPGLYAAGCIYWRLNDSSGHLLYKNNGTCMKPRFEKVSNKDLVSLEMCRIPEKSDGESDEPTPAFVGATTRTRPKVQPTEPYVPAPDSRYGFYTKIKAYRCVVEMKTEDVSDSQLAEIWEDAINYVSKNNGKEVLDGIGWWSVKERVLSRIPQKQIE